MAMNKLHPMSTTDVEGVAHIFDESTDEMKTLMCGIAFDGYASNAHLAKTDLKIWLRNGQTPEQFYTKHVEGTNLKLIRVDRDIDVIWVADRTHNRWDEKEVNL